ncbi:hypothetical protein BDR26DRAFT_862517, partial [Obelidium mucronatum]
MDGFIWFLIAPHVTNLTTASRLSRANRTLNRICNDRCIPLCFSRRFLHTLKSDLKHEALATQIPLAPIPDWILKADCLIPPTDAIKDMNLGHVLVAIDAAFETHKLHLENWDHPLKEILGWCRYVFYGSSESLPEASLTRRFQVDNHVFGPLSTRIVHLRLPKTPRNHAFETYAGGVIWISCTFDEEYPSIALEGVTLCIPKVATGRTIPIDFRYSKKGAEVEYDLCQWELYKLFHGSAAEAPRIGFVSMNTSQIETFGALLKGFQSTSKISSQAGMVDGMSLLALLFQGVSFDSQMAVGASVIIKEWIPLWLPSVNTLYDDSLAMKSMVIDVGMRESLRAFVAEEERRHVMVYGGLLLYKTQVPWLRKAEESDSSAGDGDDMSVDYEYDSGSEYEEEEMVEETGVKSCLFNGKGTEDEQTSYCEEDTEFSVDIASLLLQSMSASVQNEKDEERFFSISGHLKFEGADSWSFGARYDGATEDLDIWWIPTASLCSLIEGLTLSHDSFGLYPSRVMLFSSNAKTTCMEDAFQRMLIRGFLSSMVGREEGDEEKEAVALYHFLLIAMFAASYSQEPYGKRASTQELEVLLAYSEFWTPVRTMQFQAGKEYTLEDCMSMGHRFEKSDPGRLLDRCFDLVEKGL